MEPSGPANPVDAAERVARAGGVAALNDALARAHDIDAYYACAPWPIRLIERRRLRLIVELAGGSAAKRVLEVGCGGGHVLALFGEAELVGVDPSKVMLAKARHRLVGRRATLHHGELEAVALPAQSFDVIICTEVLEHCVSPEVVLAEMRRLLHPDGLAVVTFPNDQLIATLRRGLETVPRAFSLVPGRTHWGGDEYHLHRWTIDEMRALLSRFFALDAERFAPHRALPIRCCFRARPR